MKIAVVHFERGTIAQTNRRASGGVAAWVSGADIREGKTPGFIAAHPLHPGANAVFFVWPVRGGVRLEAGWMTFAESKDLPPNALITTREASVYDRALLKMAAAYWKDFTRLEPKFAARNADSFVDCFKSFDEHFCTAAKKPLRENFRRDMHIILSWQGWAARVEKMKLTAISRELAKSGFKVSPDLLRKLRDKYKLPDLE